MKWGEYSSDVQFILQRSDQLKNDSKVTQPTQQQIPKLQSIDAFRASPPSSAQLSGPVQMLDRNKESRKSFGLVQSEGKSPENIGIVKGIPQTQNVVQQPPSPAPSSLPETNTIVNTASAHIRASSDTSNVTASSSFSTQPRPSIEFNSADVRNSLDRKTNLFREARNLSNESLLEAYNARCNSSSEVYKNGPPISSNGALVPPPYRDPPPPRTSPLHQKSDSLINIKKFDFKVNYPFFHLFPFFFFYYCGVYLFAGQCKYEYIC